MSRLRGLIWIIGLTAGLTAAAGCEKPLFPDNVPRTPFQRYDQLRGHYSPPERRGPGFQTEPALRERLSPYRP